jgi:hypothetical protein
VRGSGRRIRTFIACFKDRQPTVSRSPSIPDDLSVSSALRESNPPCRLGRPAPLPLGQGHAFFLRAAVAGIEPASRRLTAACPYQHRPHRIDHPTTSIAQTVIKSTQWELNPHVRPGEAAGSPYIMGALSANRIVKEPKRVPSRWSDHSSASSTRAQGETRTHVAALRVRCPGR